MPPDPKKSMNPSWKQRTVCTDKEGVMRNTVCPFKETVRDNLLILKFHSFEQIPNLVPGNPPNALTCPLPG